MKVHRWFYATGSSMLILACVGICMAVPGMLLANASLNQDSTADTVARIDELSNVFRSVAQRALPAVVSIETIGKVSQRQMAQLGDGFGDDPFNDPFFRRFFGDIQPRVPRGPSTAPERRTIGQGSGFIIDPSGIIMTNAHVVEGADEVRVQLSDGRKFTATEIKTDDRADVAIVRIDVKEQLPFLAVGDDQQMEIGDWVLAFGSPFGLHRTVTQGIISAKSRGLGDMRMRQEFLQTDAAINPGNSGGPLVNLRGEVIGINTAISTSSGGYDGVGFAVPVSLAKWVGDQLIASGKVRRAYLGVVPQDIDADIAAALQMEVPQGVLIAEVTKDSPADKAGLQIQDVILELSGQRITNARKLISIAEKLTIGKTFPMVILRDGKRLTVNLTVAEFPTDLLASTSPDSGDESQPGDGALAIDELGVEVKVLTPELAEQLDSEPGRGLVVTNVQIGSLAARVGIQPGTLILRVGSTDVNSISDLESALKEARTRKQVLLFLKTSNGTQFISVPFGSRE